MEKLTPRSYVTGGFDIIKPSLIDFIGKTLRKTGRTYGMKLKSLIVRIAY